MVCARQISAILVLAGFLASNAAFAVGKAVISITHDENTYFQNTAVGMAGMESALSASGAAVTYIRVDQNVRFEALGWTLQALLEVGRNHAVLGEVRDAGPLPYFEPFKHGDVVLPIRYARAAPARGGLGVILYADFDGTLRYANGGPIGWDELPALIEHTARSGPHAVVYITANRLTKVYSVERILLAAQERGVDSIIASDPVTGIPEFTLKP